MRPAGIPKLTRHKASGRGVARINGKDVYFGPWPASNKLPPPAIQSAYDATISEWLTTGRIGIPGEDAAAGPTVADVLSAFLAHAKEQYVDADGRPTNEQDEYKMAMRPVRHLYADLPADKFSPLKLKAVRQLMVTGYQHPKYSDQAALSRGVVNQRVGRIVRIWKWAVAEELVPAEVHQALKAVAGLKKGKTKARETEPVTPVAAAVVEATLPFLRPPVKAMVQLQQLTGMRPGEACRMRACDIDMTGPVWLYRPKDHKTAHKGKDRVIALGPKAQEIVRARLKLDTQAYLFCPAEAMEAMRESRRRTRKTPLSCGNRSGTNRKSNPKRLPGRRYNVHAYSVAITRAVKKADARARKEATEEALKLGQEPPKPEAVYVPHWHPHQLRHTHATEVRRKFGLEAAQVSLGHANANVTQVYAERDLALAVKVAAAMG